MAFGQVLARLGVLQVRRNRSVSRPSLRPRPAVNPRPEQGTRGRLHLSAQSSWAREVMPSLANTLLSLPSSASRGFRPETRQAEPAAWLKPAIAPATRHRSNDSDIGPVFVANRAGSYDECPAASDGPSLVL